MLYFVTPTGIAAKITLKNMNIKDVASSKILLIPLMTLCLRFRLVQIMVRPLFYVLGKFSPIPMREGAKQILKRSEKPVIQCTSLNIISILKQNINDLTPIVQLVNIMYIFFPSFFYYKTRTPLLRNNFSTFLNFFFNKGPKIIEGVFLKRKYSGLRCCKVEIK